jgi:pyruvate,water dikinase
MMCHAAIVAREHGLPCIVGTGNATHMIRTGDEIILNMITGEISLGVRK